MRRRAGVLRPIERMSLRAASDLRNAGSSDCYGLAISNKIREREEGFQISSATLHTTLPRLERAGLLESSWEDPDRALERGRPRRRLYRITSAGENALLSAEAGGTSIAPRSPNTAAK